MPDKTQTRFKRYLTKKIPRKGFYWGALKWFRRRGKFEEGVTK